MLPPGGVTEKLLLEQIISCSIYGYLTYSRSEEAQELLTCVRAMYTSRSYYSRAAFILFRASACVATIRGWRLFNGTPVSSTTYCFVCSSSTQYLHFSLLLSVTFGTCTSLDAPYN